MTYPLHLTDFYKTDHRRQYPQGTEMVYSNLTARTSRVPLVDKVVVFGLQYFLKNYLVGQFEEYFFGRSKDVVVADYKRRLDTSLGKDTVPLDHIVALHELGYLPVRIKSLPEGTRCPIRVPFLTIQNTKDEFFWVTNFLETLMCNTLWHPMTVATIAFEFRRQLNMYAQWTSDQPEFVPWQGHDFSMRGQTSLESSCVAGAAHLLSFTGTDTIPAIDWLEEYYEANAEQELVGGSVPATEHSVMCLGGAGKFDEYLTYLRLITEVYPKGIVSIVSDTWDYWHVLNHTIRGLKDVIMARDGKVVIRPDSGDPENIICGARLESYGTDSPVYKGTIQLLWEIFGGTINSKGFKQLDPHIGVIYGDGINLDVMGRICTRLKAQGFSSTNIVFGIGSYSYQYVTRDTFGFAMKATAGMINGRRIEIFKDPVTDDGIKKSARGLLRVNGDYSLSQQVTAIEECGGLLQTRYENGQMIDPTTLQNIRIRIGNELQLEALK